MARDAAAISTYAEKIATPRLRSGQAVPLGPLGAPRNDTLGMKSSRAVSRGVIALSIPEGTPPPTMRALWRAAG